jgi:hypothetical protein
MVYYGDDLPVLPDGIIMSGTVTPDKVEIIFTVTTPVFPMKPVFKFTGTHYKNSAKLVTTGDKPTSEGRLVYEKAPGPSETKEGKAKSMIKTISSVVAGAIFFILFACCCCCLMRSRRKSSPLVLNKEEDVQLVSINQHPPPQYQPGPGQPQYGQPQGTQEQFVRY